MCRRIRLLAKIQEATVHDIVQFLFRLARLYVVFAVLSLINFISAYYTETHLIIGMTIAYTALYVINIGVIVILARQPNTSNCSRAVFSNIMLTLFNVAVMIVNFVVVKSLWALQNLVGVLVQCSTTYILYKLHEKLVNGGAPVQLDDNVAPPMAEAVVIGPNNL